MTSAEPMTTSDAAARHAAPCDAVAVERMASAESSGASQEASSHEAGMRRGGAARYRRRAASIAQGANASLLGGHDDGWLDCVEME